MLGGHSLRDDRRMAGLSFFLKAWGCEALDTLRGGEGLTVLLGRRVSLHVLVQPVILGQLLVDPMAQGQGLLARCLIAQPDSLAGSRWFREGDALENPAIYRFNARIKELLNETPRTWDGGDGFELKPDELHMTPAARAAWIMFYNHIEREQAQGGELASARPFASKAAEHAARIAGVVAAVEGSDRIEAAAMLGGIELAGFYLNEHLRLTGASRSNQTDKQLRELYSWLRESGPVVLRASVLQRSPRAIRSLKAEGINGLLTELEARGYIRLTGEGTWEVRDVPV